MAGKRGKEISMINCLFGNILLLKSVVARHSGLKKGRILFGFTKIFYPAFKFLEKLSRNKLLFAQKEQSYIFGIIRYAAFLFSSNWDFQVILSSLDMLFLLYALGHLLFSTITFVISCYFLLVFSLK